MGHYSVTNSIRLKYRYHFNMRMTHIQIFTNIYYLSRVVNYGSKVKFVTL